MLDALRGPDAVVYGLEDLAAVDARVPTFLFNLPGASPAAVSTAMAEAGIGLRDGHMYAPRLMDRLGFAMDRGAVRASLVHYNTLGEVERFGRALS